MITHRGNYPTLECFLEEMGIPDGSSEKGESWVKESRGGSRPSATWRTRGEKRELSTLGSLEFSVSEVVFW